MADRLVGLKADQMADQMADMKVASSAVWTAALMVV
jgi:hypothetical protein